MIIMAKMAKKLWAKMEIEYDETRKEEIIQNVKKVIKKEEPDVTIEEV